MVLVYNDYLILGILLLDISIFIIGIINHYTFMVYLRKKYFKQYKNLENKLSIIRLPIMINLDLVEFPRFLFNFRDKDTKLIFHKIIWIISAALFILFGIISLFQT